MSLDKCPERSDAVGAEHPERVLATRANTGVAATLVGAPEGRAQAVEARTLPLRLTRTAEFTGRALGAVIEVEERTIAWI